jgi:hypothetical protein
MGELIFQPFHCTDGPYHLHLPLKARRILIYSALIRSDCLDLVPTGRWGVRLRPERCMACGRHVRRRRHPDVQSRSLVHSLRPQSRSRTTCAPCRAVGAWPRIVPAGRRVPCPRRHNRRTT